jgi:hypothetical protein
MPLTLSHPAAVLPLRRLPLPMTVLAIASMVPDLPLFMGWSRAYEATHDVLGIVTVDVVMATVVVAWWSFVMRDAVVDLAPSPVRARLPARARPSRRDWALTPLAAVVGAGTHVLWDAFTHPGRWGAEHIGWLRSEHAGLAGSQWAQYVSGVVGLVVVVATAVTHLAKAPVDSAHRPRVLPAGTLVVVLATGVAVALLSAAQHASSGVQVMAFNAVVDSLVVLNVALVVVTIVWQLADQRGTRPSPTRHSL